MSYGIECRTAAGTLIFGKNSRLLRKHGTLICNFPTVIPYVGAPPWGTYYTFNYSGISTDGTWLVYPLKHTFPINAPNIQEAIQVNNGSVTLLLQTGSTSPSNTGQLHFEILKI